MSPRQPDRPETGRPANRSNQGKSSNPARGIEKRHIPQPTMSNKPVSILCCSVLVCLCACTSFLCNAEDTTLPSLALQTLDIGIPKWMTVLPNHKPQQEAAVEFYEYTMAAQIFAPSSKGEIPVLSEVQLRTLNGTSPFTVLAKYLAACQTSDAPGFKALYTSDSQQAVSEAADDPKVREKFISAMRSQVGFEVEMLIQDPKHSDVLYAYVKTVRSPPLPISIDPMAFKKEGGEYKMYSAERPEDMFTQLDTFFDMHDVSELRVKLHQDGQVAEPAH